MLVAGVQVALDFFALRFRQLGDLVVEIGHAVIDIDAQFLEQLGVLLESILVVNPDAVAEDDRVRNLHHRCLDVQREHHAGFAGIFQLGFIEFTKRFLAHIHAVDDLAFEQRELRLENQGLAALGEQFHLDITCLVQRQRLFAVIEVTVRHVGNVSAGGHAPFAHRMRVLAGVALDGQRCTAVGVAFAQHRIDRTAQTLRVARLDCLLFVRLRVFRKIRNIEAALLQFLDRCRQLRQGSADVRQLDNIGIGQQGQASKFAEGIRHFLLVSQHIREFSKNTGRNRDIGLLDLDTGRRSEGSNDGQKSTGSQQWRLVR